MMFKAKCTFVSPSKTIYIEITDLDAFIHALPGDLIFVTEVDTDGNEHTGQVPKNCLSDFSIVDEDK